MTGDDLHHLLHVLWSKAVNQPHYDKQEWIDLQQALFILEDATPLDPIEPEPWAGNGH